MKKILITGGCGFVGTNLAINLNGEYEIFVLDNFSKKESKNNTSLLNENGIKIIEQDIVNKSEIENIIKELIPDSVIHLGAQVAMSESIINPMADFETNVIGTLNILESLKQYSENTKLINVSSNKVYGDIAWDEIDENSTRYFSKKYKNGYNEEIPISFSGPYGCSKGSAEQYVLDYKNTFNLNTTSLRLSTIYGPNQYSTYNQGWVGWFLNEVYRQNLNSKIEISIHGNGKQVRDILYIDDFCSLITNLLDNFENVSGEAFNIGGSISNSISILELLNYSKDLFKLTGDFNFEFKDWREADQKYYASNIEKIKKATSWHPKIMKEEGISLYSDWLIENSTK